MATITPTSVLYMRNSTLTLGTPGDEFAAAIQSMTLTPSTTIVKEKGLRPGSVFSFASDPEWDLEVSYMQDWSDEDSLSFYLFNHSGETVPAVIEPEAGGLSVAVNVTIVAGAIGGALDAVAKATVTLGVTGQPVLTPAV